MKSFSPVTAYVCLSVCLSALSRYHFLIDIDEKWHGGKINSESEKKFVEVQDQHWTISPILCPKTAQKEHMWYVFSSQISEVMLFEVLSD